MISSVVAMPSMNVPGLSNRLTTRMLRAISLCIQWDLFGVVAMRFEPP
jgi:hypothetical protein